MDKGMRYPGLLKRGSKGKAVRQLQRRLIAVGIEHLSARRRLTVDGDFGPVTEDAVIEFQSQHADARGIPLEVDGKVGPVTWSILFAGQIPELVRAESRKNKKAQFMAAVLQVALDEVGVREDPAKPNAGKRVEEYLASIALGPGFSWCAAFVYWCAREAATHAGRAKVPLIRTGWTPSIWAAAKKSGNNVSPDDVISGKKKLDPGSLFVIHGKVRGTSRVKHVGIVAGSSGGMIETVEGNTDQSGTREGDGVYRGLRSPSKIHGFVTYC